MCLGVPGQLVEWIERDGIFARAVIDFAGVRRECETACVPEAEIGDYVVVHAGMAISRIDAAAAAQALAEWQSADDSDPDEHTETAS
jgi:hydrogenase expression/formation protein HypC